MLVYLFAATALAGTTTWTAPTAEGQMLVVSKRGRAVYKMRIEGGEPADTIKCGAFHNQLRSTISMQIRVAGERAAGGVQLGTVVSYTDAIASLYAGGVGYIPGLCVVGVDALPGVTVLTLGSVTKAQGRTATLTAAKAAELGSWLSEQ